MKGKNIMAKDSERAAGLVWTETIEHSYQSDFPTMAKTLGITVPQLKKILNGDEELDLDDLDCEALQRLREASGDESEQLSVDEFLEI